MNPPEPTQQSGAQRWQCQLCRRYFLSWAKRDVTVDWTTHMSAVHHLYGDRLELA